MRPNTYKTLLSYILWIFLANFSIQCSCRKQTDPQAIKPSSPMPQKGSKPEGSTGALIPSGKVTQPRPGKKDQQTPEPTPSNTPNSNTPRTWENALQEAITTLAQGGKIEHIDQKLENTHLTLLEAAIELEKADYIIQLVQAGAHVNAQDLDGRTPLHLAAEKGNIDIVKTLLAQKGIKSLPDKAGHKPIVLAKQKQEALKRQPGNNAEKLQQYAAIIDLLTTWRERAFASFSEAGERLHKLKEIFSSPKKERPGKAGETKTDDTKKKRKKGKGASNSGKHEID